MNTAKIYKSGNAQVQIVIYSNLPGYRVAIWLASGLSEDPIKYKTGGIAYDHPERVSKTIKRLVERAYRWIERTTGGDYLDQFTQKGN